MTNDDFSETFAEVTLEGRTADVIQLGERVTSDRRLPEPKGGDLEFITTARASISLFYDAQVLNKRHEIYLLNRGNVADKETTSD